MCEATVTGGAIYVCHASSEAVNFISAAEDAGWVIKQCLVWVKNTMVLGRQDYQWKHEPILYGWKPGSAHAWHGKRNKTTVIDDTPGLSIDEEQNSFLVTVCLKNKTVQLRVPSYDIVRQCDETEESVWQVPKPARNADHPTMKPVRIPAIAIRNSSLAGEIVLDLFSGSGSTLSAADQLGRRCFAMELDPKYCDVICARWEKLTGKKAVLET